MTAPDKWYTSTATINYSPKRHKTISTKWWCVADLGAEGICDYYRWWMTQQPNMPKLHKPSHPAHISMVRGECPRDNIALWGQWDGLEVEFTYRPYPRRTGDRKVEGWTPPKNFVFLEVKCPIITELRGLYGLETHFKYHLTVARIWE